jgi:hypothetical protein
MPATPQPPFHRWGVRFNDDPSHNLSYLQTLHDEDNTSVYRGELFLNEALDQMYYVDSTGIARKLGSRDPISFSLVDFSGLRDFIDDATAAAASPAVPVGGMYRTGSILKVRVV